jgi:hypothetical protein
MGSWEGMICPGCRGEGRTEARLWTPEVEREHYEKKCDRVGGHLLHPPWKSRGGCPNLEGRVRLVPVGDRWKVEYRPFPETREWVVFRTANGNGRIYYTRNLDTAILKGEELLRKVLSEQEYKLLELSNYIEAHTFILQKKTHPSSFHQGKTLLDWARWMVQNKGGKRNFGSQQWFTRVEYAVHAAVEEAKRKDEQKRKNYPSAVSEAHLSA